jgi:hypothetical protein
MCQPGVVYSAASGRVYQMQVDAQGVYFTEPDGTDVVGIDTCPLSGCTGKPRRIRANVDTDFAVAAGYVVMAVTVAAPTLSVQLCPTSGCAATPPVLTSGTRRYAFASSASDFYWLVLFGAQTLTRCVSPTAAGCTSTISPGSTAALPMAMTDTDIFVKQLSAPNDLAHLSPTVSGTPADLGISGAIITAIAAYGSDAYVLTVAPPPRILRCAGAGCPTPTLLANPSASSTEIAVDDTGIYWLAGDTIQTCPLAGCPPAGSTEIASGLSLPNHLRLQGHFVYWIEVMTYVDGGSGWMLRRVAKPL